MRRNPAAVVPSDRKRTPALRWLRVELLQLRPSHDDEEADRLSGLRYSVSSSTSAGTMQDFSAGHELVCAQKPENRPAKTQTYRENRPYAIACRRAFRGPVLLERPYNHLLPRPPARRALPKSAPSPRQVCAKSARSLREASAKPARSQGEASAKLGRSQRKASAKPARSRREAWARAGSVMFGDVLSMFGDVSAMFVDVSAMFVGAGPVLRR